jgi:hypothetical protein
MLISPTHPQRRAGNAPSLDGGRAGNRLAATGTCRGNRDDARESERIKKFDMVNINPLSISLSIRDDSEQLRTFHFNAEQLGTIRNKSKRDVVMRRQAVCPMAKRHVFQLNRRNGQLGTIGSSPCRFVPSWNDLEQFRTIQSKQRRAGCCDPAQQGVLDDSPRHAYTIQTQDWPTCVDSGRFVATRDAPRVRTTCRLNRTIYWDWPALIMSRIH